MKTYFLDDYTPELSRNLKVTVKLDGSVSLNSVVYSESSISSKMKDFAIIEEESLSENIKKYYDNSAGGDYYKKDRYVELKNTILCPLWLEDSIPEYLIISTSIEKGSSPSIKKVISLGKDTIIGRVLRTHLEEMDYVNPVLLDRKNNTVTIKGINVGTGVIQDYVKYYSDGSDINKIIKELVANRKFIIPNLINLEFELEDSLDKTKLEANYCNKAALGGYIPLIYRTKKFLPVTHDKLIGNNEFYLSSEGFIGQMIFSDPDLVPLHYAKDYLGNFSSIKTENNSIALDVDLETRLSNAIQLEMSCISGYTNVMIYRLKENFTQSDFISIDHYFSPIVLVADYLPNYVANGNEFGYGDNLEHIFNPQGSLIDGLNAFIGAWNDTSRNKTGIEAVRVGESVAFIGRAGSSGNVKISFDKLEQITNDPVDLFKKDCFLVSADDVRDVDFSNSFLQNDYGSYKIVDVRKYTKELITNNLGENYFKDIDKFNVIIVEQTKGEKFFNYIAKPEILELGVFEIADKKIIDNYYTELGTITFQSEFLALFRPEKLIVGIEYYVIGQNTIISQLGNNHNTNDSFIAIDENYKVITGNGYVIRKYMAGDQSVINLLENVNRLQSEVKSDNIIWKQSNQTSLNNEEINLSKNYYPGSETLPNITKRTNEWFVPSAKPQSYDGLDLNGYLDTKLSEQELYNNSDYLEELFKENEYSILNDWKDTSRTIFKGIELEFDKGYEGYKFSTVLNVYTQGEDDVTTEGVRFKVIRNDLSKCIVFLIEVAIGDYKYNFDNKVVVRKYFYYSLLYYLKNWRRNAGISAFGYRYLYPYPDIITTETEDFYGIRLPIRCNSSLNNRLSFTNSISLLNFISPNEEGIIKLVGINYSNRTIVSTEKYYGINANNKRVSLNPNSIEIEGDSLYVSCINGLQILEERTLSELNQFISWTDIEWYQLDGGYNSLNKLSQVLNFSYIKESINLNKPYVEKIIVDSTGSVIKNSEFKFKIGREVEKYSGKYTIKTKIKKSYRGNFVSNTWSAFNQSWDSVDITWNDDTIINNLTDLENINH